jgi:tryptophan synthase alpha chain
MNRYTKAFSKLRQQKRMALVPFAVAGDPDIATSEKVLKTYISAGADILEIGYPFSDPIADGPVNQRASQRAIAAGITPARFFAMIKRLRQYTDIPFGLLVYANTVYHLGFETFCEKAKNSGIDSILVADMPPEESRPLLKTMRRFGLQSVFIVSELTSTERMRFICRHSNAFIYVVSRLGTTGIQKDLNAAVGSTIAGLRKATSLPLCVGFGISSPQHVAGVRKAGADGAIVGSKLVTIIEHKRATPRAMLNAIYKTVTQLHRATYK